MGCHSLLQGIFLTQGSNLCLYVFCIGRQILYHQCHLGSSFNGKVILLSLERHYPRIALATQVQAMLCLLPFVCGNVFSMDTKWVIFNKTPIKDAVMYYPTRSPLGPRHSDARSFGLWWLITGFCCQNAFGWRGLIHPSLHPLPGSSSYPGLVNVRDAKSWSSCWIGAAYLGHSSSIALNVQRPLQLHHSSNSPSAQPCFLHCSQALFQRVPLTQSPAWKSQSLTMCFMGMSVCDTRSKVRGL